MYWFYQQLWYHVPLFSFLTFSIYRSGSFFSHLHNEEKLVAQGVMDYYRCVLDDVTISLNLRRRICDTGNRESVESRGVEGVHGEGNGPGDNRVF